MRVTCILSVCYLATGTDPLPMDDGGLNLLQLRAGYASMKDRTSGACPCTDGPTLNLKAPLYSNLGGVGPDVDSPQEILYPDAGIIDGQAVNVRVWTPDPYKGKASANGMFGSLGRLSMKTKQTNNFQVAVVNARTGANVNLASLAMTFLDLDEGKNGNGRVSVSACGAEQFALDASELTLAYDGSCSSATSTTKGNGADNPSSVAGAMADDVASKRVVSYVFKPSNDGIYSFTFDVSKGYGYRNILFSLSPGAACISDTNMPEGCEAALEEEALDVTTTLPDANAEKVPEVVTTTTPAPEEEKFEFVIANGQNTCPAGSSTITDAASCEAAAPSLKFENQRNGRWEGHRGSSFSFMPPGCVLYTGWTSGMHEAIVVFNNDPNGKNDGHRAKVCEPFAVEEEPEAGQEPIDYIISQGQSACPAGTDPIADAASCEAAAPSLQYQNQRHGRWEGHRGNSFSFMPPGCVLYTTWTSGMHEAIVVFNNNANGKNDGHRAVVCQPGSSDQDEEEAAPVEVVEPYIGVGANTCPPGKSPVGDAASCEAMAPSLKYGSQRHGRWEGHRGNSFSFMPPGCVLYTGWSSGQHEAIVVFNNNANGRNDGYRAVICS